MEVETTRFGGVQVEEQRLITFSGGLLGFGAAGSSLDRVNKRFGPTAITGTHSVHFVHNDGWWRPRQRLPTAWSTEFFGLALDTEKL